MSIKVVVVDDSAFMRKALTTMLEKDPEIRVVAQGRNGEEGLELIRKHQPDVVTLDIEMPRMDGLTALRRIMMEMPRPVLMISSLTTEGAESTLKALELGAVDFIPKQLSKVSLDIIKIEEHLISKVKTVARRAFRAPRALRAPAPPPSQTTQTPQTGRTGLSGQAGRTRSSVTQRPATATAPAAPVQPRGGRQLRDVVAIGVSTGGPPAVQKVLAQLPANYPAGVLIAQHMPAAFTGPFAKRLDAASQVRVKEAEDGERFTPGVVYIGPGGRHLTLAQRGARMEIRVSDEPASELYKPSANILIRSVAETSGRRALGAILTGMGSDGLEGIRLLKSRGGRAIAQNDASCVVYGMPKAVVDAGLADEVLDIEEMGQALMDNLYK